MIEILFWVFLILALLGNVYYNRDNYPFLFSGGIVWFLLLLLGLQVFHNPLK